MQAASEDLDFERAAVYRDRLAALSPRPEPPGHQPAAASRRPTSSPSTRRAAQTCIQVFFFRTGQNWGNRAYFPKADPATSRRGEVLGVLPRPVLRRQALCRASSCCRTTVEEQELLEEALSTKAGHKVSVQVPQRGEKKDLVDHALHQCPRGARPPAGGDRRRRRGCSPASPRRFGLRRAAAAASRSTTTPTSWAPTRSAR